MTVWRKILVSGSNAHVAAITASVAGTPIDKSQAVLETKLQAVSLVQDLYFLLLVMVISYF